MKLRFECREESCPALIEYRPKGESQESFACPRCGRRYTVHQAAQLIRGEPLRQCAMCAGEELFIRKDFPQKTGLAIVVFSRYPLTREVYADVRARLDARYEQRRGPPGGPDAG